MSEHDRQRAPSAQPVTATVDGVIDAQDVHGEQPVDEPDRSLLVRWQLSPWDAVGLAAALLLLTLFAPPLMFEAWTPRAALVAAVAPIGIVLLVTSCRLDRHSRRLILVLAWVLLAALLGPRPRSALLGFVGRDLSAVTVIGSTAFWMIGRVMSRRGRDLLVDIVVWAGGFAALVGLLQTIVQTSTGPLALAAGRPIGLYSNPVYFGALCAAGAVAAAPRLAQRPLQPMLAPAMVLGIGVSLSGSRVALLAAVSALFVFMVAYRTRRALLAVGMIVASMVFGVGLDRLVGAGRNSVDRLAASDGGGRTQAWIYGLQSLADAPVFGHGYGAFRAAVQSRFSVDFVTTSAFDERSQAWFDAHNVVVSLLVASGAIGMVLWLVWLVPVLRRVRGPLVWALLPIAAHWMLQPVSLFTLPLAMLLLGAAMSEDTVKPLPSRRVVAAPALLGVALALALLAGDISLRTATRSLDAEAAERIANLYPNDAIVDDLVAQIHSANGDRMRELEWRERVSRDEPDRPFWWTQLARRQIDLELYAEAELSVQRAYELQPHNTRTLRTEMLLALELEDEQRLAALLERSCAFGMGECELDAADLIAGVTPAGEDTNGG